MRMFRPAEDKDQKTVVTIFNQAIAARRNAHLEKLSGTKATQWFKTLVEGAHEVELVLTHEGECAGWGCLTPYRNGRGALETTLEITFYLDEQHHRKGYGSALVQHLEDRALLRGCRHLVAILLDDNVPSIAMLESCSYLRWANFEGIVHFADGDRGHLYMGKHLPLSL